MAEPQVGGLHHRNWPLGRVRGILSPAAAKTAPASPLSPLNREEARLQLAWKPAWEQSHRHFADCRNREALVVGMIGA